MSFQQGLSGLGAASQNLDVIGNNVANSSTVGFKQGVASFADVYASSLGAGGGADVGIGVQVSGVSDQFTQGNITTTSNPLDLAINGKGFFRMSDNGAISYTRNGQFQLDKNGYLVGPTGQNLTGFQALNGTIVPGVLVNLQLSSADVLPKASANAVVGVNLSPTSATLPTAGFVATDPTTYNYSTSTTAYDSLGQSHTLTYYFNKTAANTWDVNTYIDGAAANGAGVSTLTFNSSGAYVGATNLSKTATFTNGAAPLSLTMNFSQMMQTGATFGVNSLSTDGYASGQLSGYNIGADGTIVGDYSNGQTQILGQVALSNFVNPQGLAPEGGNMFTETSASGVALTGAPGSASLGALQSSAQEDSNVDLTAELVNMITAQRDYQASAQSIKTEDAVMQTLINMR
jgi:flagellar hook protein FlgE